MRALGLSFDGMNSLVLLIVMSTAVVKWRGLRGLVAIPAAIVLTFGEQIGFFAGISPGSWPSNATGAVFFGVLSDHGLRLVVVAYAIFLGLMLLAGKYGSRPLGEQLLALLRATTAKARAMPAKDLFFWAWIISGTGALLMLVLTLVFSSRRAVPVALLCILTVFLVARLIGAIKSAGFQSLALVPIALLMGLSLGFSWPTDPDFNCNGDRELVLRSGERLACVAWSPVQHGTGGLKFILVQGPSASAVVWPIDVEPGSALRVFGPEFGADFLARLAK